MNTNQLKIFAQKARTLFRQGVANQLRYWGFTEKGAIECQPKLVGGGVIHREAPIDDPTVLEKWQALAKAVSKNGFDQVVEEAAYTWFNRIMAIRILSKNKYDLPQLEYGSDELEVPLILQRARRGQLAFLSADEKSRLQPILTNYDKEQQAFAILLTGYCHSHKLLKRVFGRLNDYTELLLPADILTPNGFIHFLNTTQAISDTDYQQVELIGWLYQFYISEKKDEVFKQFKKNKKAEAKDIPAATQIFTPNWIVKYMVENTLGKLWLDQHPDSPIRENMKYLVETSPQNVILSDSEESATNVKTASSENEATNNALSLKSPLGNRRSATANIGVEGIKLLDPAAGSGHILVEGFELLYQMYDEEYYMPNEAIESIFTHNLFGLDIDQRAAQLAQFALLMKAAQKHPAVLYTDIIPKVFAMPEPTDFSRQDVLDFLGSEGLQFEEAFTNILQLMQQAQNLGSVMKFDCPVALRDLLKAQLNELKNKQRNNIEEALFQKIAPFVEVLLILTNRYEAIAANPPYMGQSNMNAQLKQYINTHYPDSKSDLMTVFMEVIPELSVEQGRFALINLPSWLFLSSFEKLRKNFISAYSFESLLHMGRGIFGIDFGSVAFTLTKTSSEEAAGSYFRLHERNFQHIYYEDIKKLFLYSNGNTEFKYDFNCYRDEGGVNEIPQNGTIHGQRLFYPNVSQSNFSKIPGSPIAYWVGSALLRSFQEESLLNIANPKKGLATTDNNRFLRLWTEVECKKAGFNYKNREDAKLSKKKWFPINKGGGFRKWFGNANTLINWYDDGEELKNAIVKRYNGGSYTKEIRSEEKYFKNGITWSALTSNKASFRHTDYGALFDSAGSTMNPQQNTHSILGLLNTKVCEKILAALNPTLNFGAGTVSNIPVVLPSNLSETESISNKSIKISENDWDSRETSWDFQQSPLINPASNLPEAYQQWEQQATKNFYQLHANEEELNRIFIDIYGLNEELDPVVPLKDITILQDEMDSKQLENMETILRQNRQWNLVAGKWQLSISGETQPALPIKKEVVIKQFISYAIGCMMGRYSLAKPGLILANQGDTLNDYHRITGCGDFQIADNTAKQVSPLGGNRRGAFEPDDDAIIPLMGNNCIFPDDALRRFNHFVEVIWGEDSLTQNLNFVGECLGDKTDIEKYLVKQFWKDHCKTYKKKPIYWLFSSEKGAFQVLVYMHRMNKFTVDKIRSKYMLKHLQYLEQEIDRLQADASNLSRADQKKLDTLRNQQKECQAYELVLKDFADRQIEFDLDEGVTQNLTLFEGVIPKIK